MRQALCARLRRSNIDASEGTVDELARIMPAIRQRWPEVSILVRADSGFARNGIFQWCEDHDVDYVIGLARNSRLERILEPALERAEKQCEATGQSARVYEELRYRTQKSWSRARRVVAKAEVSSRGRNPRYVVTSLAPDAFPAQTLYEEIYCARGDMENRIKEQQLDLFATRTSGHLMRVNQLRLWLSSVAYCLIDALRRIALQGTDLARAYCGTIRLKLLKIGARIRVSVRKVWVFLASSHPGQEVFAHAYRRLRAGP